MFAVCMALGLLCAAAGIVFYKPLFGLLGAGEAVLEYAGPYFIVTFISALFSIMAQFLNYIAAAESNMKLGMVAFNSNSAIHVALMPVLIFALDMGLLGAAVTSLTAQIACLTLMLLPYIRKKMLISLSVRNIVWKRGMIPQVIKSGIPLGITQILMAFSIAFTNIMGKWLLQDAGESFIAGYGVAVKIMVMVQYLIITYMIGYQAVAAYSYGAKNRARFWEAYRHTRKVVLFAGISAAVLFSLLSWPLVRLFTADPQITQYAVAMMISMAASLAISFPLPPVITAYQATGKGGAGALISSLRQGIVYIPLVLTLPRLLSVWGFYILQPVSDMLSIAIALLVFRQSRKKLDAELTVPPE
jgi:Na+-driven multidrug efflux pump